MALHRERIEFPGSRGAGLAARLDLPAGEPRAYALFAHCFTCSKESFAASRISAALAERGIAVLRFDFTGLGGSGGDFASTDFSSNVEDLLAAAEHLRATRRAPALLIGHSLGGTAVLAAAGRIPEARAVATVGAPSDPAHVLRLLGGAVAEMEREGEAEVDLAGRRFRVRREFLDDVAGRRLDEAVASMRKALLILHGPRDEVVGIDHASRIFAAARHPKSFVSLDDADHLLSRREDAAYAAEVLAAWASRYLGAPAAATGAAAELPPGEVLVEETGAGRFAERVRVGRHVLAADEPVSVGGTDTGPGPYDYLLAGLGACTAMTLRLYADRKQWPLARVSVRLRHAKIHAADCAECETREGAIDRIERSIELAGELGEEQRAKLLEIADKCPVHRTLESEIAIRTVLSG
jgi:putative redox protein